MSLLKALMAANSSMLCTWNDLNLDWIHHDQTSFPPFPTNQKDVYHSNLNSNLHFHSHAELPCLTKSCWPRASKAFFRSSTHSIQKRHRTAPVFGKPPTLVLPNQNFSTTCRCTTGKPAHSSRYQQKKDIRKSLATSIQTTLPGIIIFFLTSVKVRGVSKCARAKASWSCSRRSDILCHTTLTRGFPPCAVNVTWAFDAALLDVVRVPNGETTEPKKHPDMEKSFTKTRFRRSNETFLHLAFLVKG